MANLVGGADISFLICSHFSSNLIGIQIDWFHRLNPQHNYKLIVSDDSDDVNERAMLEKWKDAGEIDDLVFVTSDSVDGSERHALSLASGFQLIKTRYICFMDVDYFWLKNDYASFLITKLQSGNCRVFGMQRETRYNTIRSTFPLLAKGWLRNIALRVLNIGMTVDRQLSPGIFCLCMETDLINKNSLSFSYPGMILFRATGRDTGYQVRQFIERTIPRDQIECLKPVNYEPWRRGTRVGHIYLWDGELIGIHLNHATVPKGPDTTLTEEEIQATRELREKLREELIRLKKNNVHN